MLLTPKGKSHRDLLPSQELLQIAAARGALTQTEQRTRDFTDNWKTNLLKQKPPNANGIQCYDPLLNRDIVKKLDKEYKRHIKVEGQPKRGPGQGGSNNSKDSDGNYYNSRLLLEVYGSQRQQPSEGEQQTSFDGTRDVVAATMTPPALSTSTQQSSRVYRTGRAGGLQIIETQAPKPLSPSVLAQKLRRYKIGHSPQQKVKNLMDDIGMNEKEENAKKEQTVHAKQPGLSPFDANDSMG